MSIIISILALGVLIALHEWGHFSAARLTGMRVLRFSVGFFKSIWSYTSKKTGTVFQIGILPLGGFVQIKGMNPFEEEANTHPESFQNKAIWRRGLVLIAGPVVNLITAFFMLFVLYASSGTPRFLDKAGVGMVVSGSPADKAGLQEGDDILAVNDTTVKKWEDLTAILRAHPDKKVRLEIRRDGSPMMVFVTPMNEDGIGKIGIGQPQEYLSMPLHYAALAAGIKCKEVLWGSLSSIAGLFSKEPSDVKAIGPPGIIKMAASTLDSGIRDFVALLAYLSLMLFLFNMLPFPALDGGRGVFLLYEAISRRKVSPKVDAVVNTAGFVILMSLLLFMSVRDIIS